MALESPTREVLWNITGYAWIYPVFIICLGICIYGIMNKVAYWRGGAKDPQVHGPWWPRIQSAIIDIVSHRRLFKVLFAGTLHAFIFWSFAILLFATSVVAVDMHFVKVFHGSFYLWVSLLADIAGAFFTVGLAMALFRRYVKKPTSLKSSWQDAVFHSSFLFLMISGFLLEGIRIRYAGDPWAWWTPFGYLTSFLFMPFPESVGRLVHVSLWWTHAFVTFGFVALIPFTKMFHLIAIPMNSVLRRARPRGALARVDLEAMMEADDVDELVVGIDSLNDLTWKQRLEHDACIECNRCNQVCPAHVTGHNLSPMQIMLNLRDAGRQAQKLDGDAKKEAMSASVVGTVVEAESLWECRTCYACVDACPAHLDQLGQIIDMRRSEVLMKGEIPAEGQTLLRDLETRGNPFGDPSDRLNWIEKEGFRVLKPGESVEVLYWIGCATSFDPRKQKVARDLVTILETANVSYAVLGEAEGCNGDPARVLGDENIFQMMAKEQAGKIPTEQFTTLLVNCPHCFNAFDNEYPQFGMKTNVMHHSEFIKQLLDDGKIKITKKTEEKITFHDPCYLGRVQGVYDAPRSVLEAASGQAPLEMERNKAKSGCCGAGGGHFWMDLRGGDRLDTKRVEEAQAAGADTIGVGCVFCMQMLENGVKAKELESSLQVKDIAEIVAAGLAKEQANTASQQVAS